MLCQQCFNLVDWGAINDAQTCCPDGFSLWISKHVTSFCGIGKIMLRWEMWDNNRCPGCDMENEVAQPVLVCDNVKMQSEFRNVGSLTWAHVQISRIASLLPSPKGHLQLLNWQPIQQQLTRLVNRIALDGRMCLRVRCPNARGHRTAGCFLQGNRISENLSQLSSRFSAPAAGVHLQNVDEEKWHASLLC